MDAQLSELKLANWNKYACLEAKKESNHPCCIFSPQFKLYSQNNLWRMHLTYSQSPHCMPQLNWPKGSRESVSRSDCRLRHTCWAISCALGFLIITSDHPFEAIYSHDILFDCQNLWSKSISHILLEQIPHFETVPNKPQKRPPLQIWKLWSYAKNLKDLVIYLCRRLLNSFAMFWQIKSSRKTIAIDAH